MRIVLLTVLFSAVALFGCADSGAPPTPDTGADTGTVDSGADTGVVDSGGDAEPADSGTDTGLDSGADTGTDTGVPPTTVRQLTFQSSGGGAASSTSYRLRLSVGAPQPTGAASGSANSVITGPAAARP